MISLLLFLMCFIHIFFLWYGFSNVTKYKSGKSIGLYIIKRYYFYFEILMIIVQYSKKKEKIILVTGSDDKSNLPNTFLYMKKSMI